MKKYALISVSDKRGITDFSRGLVDLGYDIISTGGTAKALRDAGIKVTGVSDITGFPECLDGRVKTLHPAIHAGILAIRDNRSHMEKLRELDIDTIDVVAINLYPFKQTIEREGVTLNEAIEQIDIGGPAMLRSAAKNYRDVTVVVDPSDYDGVLNELKKGELSDQYRLTLCYKVFEHTSHYDTLIADYLRGQAGISGFRDTLTLTYEKLFDLRYGENPHQKAAYYKECGKREGCVVNAEQLHGKELSFCNINDVNGAVDLIKEFSEPAVAAVKHANPCGVGIGEDIFEAYKNAYDADSVSIYGGIIAANREIDSRIAQHIDINGIFIEIITAPSFSEEAFAILTKKKNIRILKMPDIMKPYPAGIRDIKKVSGGILAQDFNAALINEEQVTCVTERQPSDEEKQKLMFAWRVVKHTKSNAIVLVKGNQTVGIGSGQTNRVTSLKIAIDYAGGKAAGAVMASDAYIPFSDSIEAAHEAGITAVIQPGGSIRDRESVDLCDKYGMAMLYTGIRHFKH